MVLRLTDGSQYDLQDCKQECDPESGDDMLICTLSKEYDFNEVTKILKKDEIAEIISVLDETGFIFQSNDYTNVASITNDIKTKTITIKFNNKKN